MYYNFLINVIVVLFFGGVVIMIDLSFQRKYTRYILGVIFGLITIVVMTGKIMVIQDRFLDFRHITMTLAGVIGGPISAGTAALISSLYQYNVGGSSTMGGIGNIIVFACFGSLLGKYMKNNQHGKEVVFSLITGILMALIVLLLIAITPPWKSQTATVLKLVSGPLLLLTPIATVTIFYFYFWTYKCMAKVSILNAILNHNSLNLMIFDAHRPILYSKNLKGQPHFSQFIENYSLLLSQDDSGQNVTNPAQREIETQDGRQFVADLSSFQMPSGLETYVAIVNDVTNQKRDQKTLRGANDRFSKSFQLGPHMMAILRKSDYKFVDVNHRFLETRGYTLGNVIGKTPMELGVPELDCNKLFMALEKQSFLQNIEYTFVTDFNSKITVILSAVMIQIMDQECILMAYNDVTEMKQMQVDMVEQLTQHLKLEMELSRSNQLIADIIDNMPDGFYVLDDQWRFTYLNREAEKLFLKQKGNLLGIVIWDVLPQAKGTLIELNYQKAKEDCVPITFENLSLLSDDTWLQITVLPSQFGLIVYFRDITEQKFSKEKLMKSQEETASILESMTDCFFAVDMNWQLTYINRAGETAFGKSRQELLGKKITEVIKVNDTLLRHYETIKDKKSISFEIYSKTVGNKWLEVNAYLTDTGFTCYFRDITSRKIAENEIARLDRLNLVGQLAAGIGHEIRNPMTTVRGYLQLLGEKPDYLAQKSTFELMISELDRANSIISEFLSLARTKQTELKTQNLNDILKHIYPLLEADAFTQNKQISFSTGEIPNLKLNAKEISQLVFNLTRNGLEAMGERGCLSIASFVEVDKVVLSIKDEGCGILSEDLQKLGTPFFTTKENGTGLGLATCYKIAESHNAKIDIVSSSSGTTFLIVFPIPNEDNEQNEMIA